MDLAGNLFGTTMAQQLTGTMCFCTMGLIWALMLLYFLLYFAAYVLKGTRILLRR